MTTTTITLQRILSPPLPDVASVGRGRPARADDIDDLGTLYHRSYPPGVATDTVREAIDDVRASWEGVYGPFAAELSPVAEMDGHVRAAVMTVWQATWPDTPTGPFVIEVFTDPAFRRRGLAASLLSWTLATASETGADRRPTQGPLPSTGVWASWWHRSQQGEQEGLEGVEPILGLIEDT